MCTLERIAILSLLFCLALVSCDADDLLGESNRRENPFLIPQPDSESGTSGGELELFGVVPFAGVQTFRVSDGLIAPISTMTSPDGESFQFPGALAIRGGDFFVWNNRSGIDFTGVLLQVDPCSGEAQPVDANSPPQGLVSALAFLDDSLYGVGPSEVGLIEDGRLALFDIDRRTGVKTQIGRGLTTQVTAMETDADGTLWGIGLGFPDQIPLRLVTIDTELGNDFRGANIGIDLANIDGMAFDDEGRLFCTGISDSGDAFLFEVDPGSGAVSNTVPIQSIPTGLGFAEACAGGGNGAIQPQLGDLPQLPLQRP